MRVGFIGAGNMGGGMLRGLTSKAPENKYFLCGRDAIKTEAMAQKLNVEFCRNITDLVEKSDIFFIGVKPVKFDEVMPQIKGGYTSDKICVSMAAGITIKRMEKDLGETSKIIRIMPNTPVIVGEGMISVSVNSNINEAEETEIKTLLKALGHAETVREEMIHAVIGVSGSSPAYTYMYIKGLMDNAVKNGMDPKQARNFAAQAVLGAAKMVLESDTDVEQLINNVCSPGGTTIEAVKYLESSNFERTVNFGAQRAVDKSIKMNG